MSEGPDQTEQICRLIWDFAVQVWLKTFLHGAAHLYLSMHINTVTCPQNSISIRMLGPVVQSVVSLTSLLRVISLTVLADSIHNILIFFAEKM